MQHWVFGYGSLIWRPDFPYRERRRATLRGWVRRFWQGSHDHRGSPDAPGRVATLVASPGSICVGVAYAVHGDVLEHLDHREQNGYERLPVTMQLCGTGESPSETVDGVTYIAPAGNAAFLGAADMDAMAQHIARAKGPSGSNADYLLRLARALDDIDAADKHVRELAQRLRTHPELARNQ